jgi:hypothetical protein
LTKAKQMVAGTLLRVLMPGVMSSPALAINDVLVPAENYAPANADAVGHPAASALVQTGQVSRVSILEDRVGEARSHPTH